MPSAAPVAANQELAEAEKVASRKTVVSKPSFNTARNAITTRARDDPVPSAWPAAPSSSRLRPRAWAFIHSTMPVTNTTATMPMIASMPSCCACGRLCSTTFSAIPTPRLTTRAAATPINIGVRERPFRFKNAATMPTMRAASSPSRRPMMKVASTSDPRVLSVSAVHAL